MLWTLARPAESHPGRRPSFDCVGVPDPLQYRIRNGTDVGVDSFRVAQDVQVE